jgi:hypothetical protein
MSENRGRKTNALAVGVGLLAVACGLSTTSSDARREERNQQVVAAVFGYQIEHLSDLLAAADGVVCLTVEPRDAAATTVALLARRARTRPGSHCASRTDGAVESSSGAPALLLVVRSIEWVNEAEALVEASHFRSGAKSGLRTYRVVHEAERWVCLGVQMEDGQP